MGVTAAAAKFLIQARASGVRFDRTITLGHQQSFVRPRQLEELLRRYNCWPTTCTRQDFDATLSQSLYIDSLFALLGATQISSLDNSDYEGADIVHDMNCPVPIDLHQQFDLVFDGGTLEHVFNFPVAIKNSMDMVKVGGHLILFTPANNYFGHGFYQFSPELFYRVLSDENGFKVERMVALENDIAFSKILGHEYTFEINSPWYEVADPDSLRKRVLLLNDRPTTLLIQATRIRVAPTFSTYPQQSDYAAIWKNDGGNQTSAGETVPRSLKHWLKGKMSAHRYAYIKTHIGPIQNRLSSRLRSLLRLNMTAHLLGRLDLFRFQRWSRDRSFHNNKESYKPLRD